MRNLVKHFIYISTLISFSFLFLSCAPADLSQTSWGSLYSNKITSNTVMLTVAPNEPVAVCGTEEVRNTIKEAIIMWASAIGRDKYMNIVGCDDVARVKIDTNKKSNIGVPAYIDPVAGDITYKDETFPILLHEIGHAWGLCDQYAGVNNCNEAIKGHGNRNKVGDSVMATAKFSELKEDDIEGIKYVTSISEVPTNASWDNIDETIRINSNKQDDSSEKLAGSLTVTQRYNQYQFRYTPTEQSGSSKSIFKVCLLDKATCLKSVGKISHPRVINLQRYRDYNRKEGKYYYYYLGQSARSNEDIIKINFPDTVYLLEMDSSSYEVLNHKIFKISGSGKVSTGTQSFD